MTHSTSLTVELPAETIRYIEERVSSGDYASVSAAVADAIDGLRDEHSPSDEWIRREVLPVVEACERDPSRLIPADEVFAAIEERHRREMEAPGRAA